jgi:D-3-phosphoglycerate dehydrogenase
MQVSRQGDQAIGVLNVDSAVSPQLASEIAAAVDAKAFTVVNLEN